MIRLLIVDDSALMRKLLSGIFEAEGDFELRLARNGEEALDIARSWRPMVVTLDITMPVMDGLTCLEQIMLEAPCPVVMVSSRTRAGAEVTLRAMELGAVDFIAKPDGTVSLGIERIRRTLVDKVRAAASARLRRSLRLRDRVRHQLRDAFLPSPDIIGTRVGRSRRPMPVKRPMRVPVEAGRTVGEGMVLLGASTGGPQAIEAVLGGLPEDFPWPILVAQHMPASFTGVFAERLNRLCALEVMEVARPVPVLPGQVYIGHGDADLVVVRRPSGLMAMPVPESSSFLWHPSVDRLVESAMEHVAPSRLIGVLLTGMGNDGAAAMARLRAEGGRTIAEDESTAVIWGMPGELVRSGAAERVVPLQEVGAAILDLMT